MYYYHLSAIDTRDRWLGTLAILAAGQWEARDLARKAGFRFSAGASCYRISDEAAKLAWRVVSAPGLIHVNSNAGDAEPQNLATAALVRSRSQHPTAVVHYVYADVLDRAGEKLGHVCSNGFGSALWSFWPVSERRRDVHNKRLDEVVPRWAKGARFGAFETEKEYRQAPADANRG